MRAKFSTTLAAGVLTASTMLGTAAAPGTAVAAPVPIPAPASAPADPAVRAQADRLMKLSYREFAKARHVAPFNWTTDGCSVPIGLTPYREVFRPACVQHDFGYRNYGRNHELKLDPTRKTKNWIDGRFRTEMRRICADRYAEHRRLRNCRSAAETYYLGVQIGGDGAFF
ncbi:phospholipase A2 [Streptomyces sp. CA-250714]|uniref:phospholipase A2 n=1 Tax=Streptomyces sp. CA-250714 TaxID=3240060 RepID=UPI003D921DB0